MASRTQRIVIDPGEPDIGFQAGFGFYLAIVAAGIAAVAGLLAGARTATLLSVVPSMVTVVAIIGHILAKRAHGLPERIGQSRRWRLACYLPSATFAALLLVRDHLPITGSERFNFITIVFAVLSGVSAYGIQRMARNRYTEALVADEPAAAWPWQRPGDWSARPVFTAIMALLIVDGLADMIVGDWFPGLFWVIFGVVMLYSSRSAGLVFTAVMALLLVDGLANMIVGDWFPGLFWVIFGIVMLYSSRFDLGDTDETGRRNPPTLRAHEAGLVIDRPFRKTVVPWDSFGDIRLTDDELVLERSQWFDVRCDRTAIDDPEAVVAGIERVRSPAHPRESLG
ncbi:PH domain-containing protein [Halopiger djelfimassiliensis]|uniref:PH domain-containing protein n=1 Tax=Halopiger djelfimassiliensis TaxID=1293047 RepID=UPI000677BA3E|nr:PH domain-containing protein [Halopiger djelfimassiliensis]